MLTTENDYVHNIDRNTVFLRSFTKNWGNQKKKVWMYWKILLIQSSKPALCRAWLKANLNLLEFNSVQVNQELRMNLFSPKRKGGKSLEICWVHHLQEQEPREMKISKQHRPILRNDRLDVLSFVSRCADHVFADYFDCKAEKHSVNWTAHLNEWWKYFILKWEKMIPWHEP